MDNPQRKSPLSLLRKLRPHYIGTYIAMLPAAVVMVLLVVPGEIVDIPKQDSNGAAYSLVVYSHGWPFEYMSRNVGSEESLRMTPKSSDPLRIPEFDWRKLFSDAPWTRSGSWKVFSHTLEKSFWPLVADLFVFAAFVFGAGLTYEIWRRRRERVWQFSISELALVVTLTGASLGFVCFHQHLHTLTRQARQIELTNSKPGCDCLQPRSEYMPYILLGDYYCRTNRDLETKLLKFEQRELASPFKFLRMLFNPDLGNWTQHPQYIWFSGREIRGDADSRQILGEILPLFPQAELAVIDDSSFDEAAAEPLAKLPSLKELALCGNTLNWLVPHEVAVGGTIQISSDPHAKKYKAYAYDDRFEVQLAALGKLKRLQQLEALTLTGDVDSRVWREIAPLPHLSRLELRSDSLYEPMRGLGPKDIEELNDSNLFPQLVELNATIDDGYNPAGLGKLNRLKKLTLHDSLDNRLVDAIAQLVGLEHFEFESNFAERSFNVDVKKFARLQNLKTLKLSEHVTISDEEFSDLQAALPSCKIECQANTVQGTYARERATEKEQQFRQFRELRRGQ